MKKIIAFGIFLALCATCFAGCDMGNGLIAELFGNGVGDYVPGGDVLVDPIEPAPMPVETVPETWTEIWTDIDYAIPEFVDSVYLSIEVVYEDGSHEQLYIAEQLKDWNHTLELDSALLEHREANLVIHGYACFNVSNAVSYDCNIPYSTVLQSGIDATYTDYIYSDRADYLNGFVLTVPVNQLMVGYNEVDVYAYAAEIEIDGWVMLDKIDILLEVVESVPEITEPADTDCPVPPETMPAEDMTGAPDVEETAEDVTYG